ncbi:MAG: hypothetical protein RR228_03145, partial [Bacilli bacterium]
MNQDLINDLNNILGVMPNATNANPTINEDVLGNLEDLVNSLPNLDGTLDVNTPEEDPVSLKDIISLYNATIDGLEEKIKQSSYTSSEVENYEKRLEVIVKEIENKKKDIERVTKEIEDSLIENENYNSLSDNYKSIKAVHTTFIGRAKAFNDIDHVKEVEEIDKKQETVNKLITSNDEIIKRSRQELITYNEDIIKSNNEVESINEKLTSAKEKAINEAKEANTKIRDNVSGCLIATEFNDAYNSINPKAELQSIISSYSNGTIDDVQLLGSLNGLRDIFNGDLQIYNNLDEIEASQLYNNIFISRTESQLNDTTKTSSEIEVLRNNLYIYKATEKALNLQETCILNGITSKLNEVITKVEARVNNLDNTNVLKHTPGVNLNPEVELDNTPNRQNNIDGFNFNELD